MSKKVVIGMSGGVDSSVSAILLKDAGYDVVGLFMHNWDEEDNGQCTSAQDWQDVIGVCGKIGIPCYSVNFAKEYMDRVFSYFLDEYKKGRTPNPDVLCNREIKFGPFVDYAKQMGADYVATGHYCDVFHGDDHYLLTARDENKDQTYFLNQVRTEQLSSVLFPLASIPKPKVREIAEKYGLINAKKKDSTGICFIGERKFRQFLSTYLPGKQGKIVDINGNVIGDHYGLMYYTLGQRKGLGIGGVKGEKQDRWYVVDKDLKTNRLIVSCGEGEELFSNACECSNLNLIGKWEEKEFYATAKFRYRQGEQKVFVKIDGTKVKIEFDQPQRAVTAGQYAVIYTPYDDARRRCLGGAVIDNVIKY